MKQIFFFIINFQKEKANTLLIILIVKSLQIELHSTNFVTMTPNLPEKTCNHPKVRQLLGD